MAPELKLCRMTTVPLSLGLLMEGQLEYMQEHGFEVTALSSPGQWLDRVERERGVRTAAVPMTRSISPLADLLALWRLYRMFRHEKFHIVHSHTPKAGLLGMIAARAAGVPVRIHTFAGTATDDLEGFKWKVIKYTDRVTALFATHCLAISHSLRQLLVDRGACPPDKIEVLLSGSSNGIDLGRFSPSPEIDGRAARIRKELKIPEAAPVIVFIGRVVRDKGVVELVEAFGRVASRRPDAHLVLVGPWEQELDPLPESTVERIKHSPAVHSVGFQEDIEAYLAMSSILAVPTYREGFGNVFIQAAAMMRPVVGTRIPGVINAVSDGENGVLVPPRDADALAGVLQRLLDFPEERNKMGKAGRAFVERNFERGRILEALESRYRALLGSGS